MQVTTLHFFPKYQIYQRVSSKDYISMILHTVTGKLHDIKPSAIRTESVICKIAHSLTYLHKLSGHYSKIPYDYVQF